MVPTMRQCIAIDENRFTVFTAEEMCHLVEYLCTI